MLSSDVAMRLPWPLPALGAWGVAWLSFALAASEGVPAEVAVLLALWMPLWLAWCCPSPLRRVLLMGGFPLALWLQGQVSLPAMLWLAPLALLLLLYPMRAWRDAPLFPTGVHALKGLSQQLGVEGSVSILDAGSGLGHGLRALRVEWPQARLNGVEHSAVLALLSRLWCRDAQVEQGDMWRCDWAPHDIVYLFQRPESMPRAWDKACKQMRPGSWLVSLEFALPSAPPDVLLLKPGERPVLAWRVPGHVLPQAPHAAPVSGAQSAARHADKSDRRHRSVAL